jgi:hypothetical protein
MSPFLEVNIIPCFAPVICPRKALERDKTSYSSYGPATVHTAEAIVGWDNLWEQTTWKSGKESFAHAHPPDLLRTKRPSPQGPARSLTVKHLPAAHSRSRSSPLSYASSMLPMVADVARLSSL